MTHGAQRVGGGDHGRGNYADDGLELAEVESRDAKIDRMVKEANRAKVRTCIKSMLNCNHPPRSLRLPTGRRHPAVAQVWI